MILRFASLAFLVSVLLPEFGSCQVERADGSSYDYVVVGGGVAGVVVASRLSEDPNYSVLLIEAGDFEYNNPNVTNTTVLGIGQGNPRLDWQYKSIPQTSTNGRNITSRSGKGLGGGSLINGMTYMRPARDQIDLWPSLGLEIDWEILFNNSKYGEKFQIPSQRLIDLGAGYESSVHGFEGPLTTCISPNIATSDINNIFTETFDALDFPHRIEFNGGDLRGAGLQQVTQNSTANIREDAARAYYYPIASERPNLSVMVNTTGLRIIWKQDKIYGEAVAAGVEIRSQDGSLSTVHADKEVILSAGAIRSPVILERSGVGNPAILSQHSIDLKVELPAVGENFQDQPTLSIIAPSFRNETGFPAYVAHVSLHDLFGTETDAVYAATLAKLPEYSRRIAEYNRGASDASAQERLLKTQLDLIYASNTPAVEIVPLAISTIIGAVFWVHQPLSRGSVHIGSMDSDIPRIDTKLFDLDFDGVLSIAAAKWILKFLDTSPVSGILNGSAIVPAFGLQGSDDEWLDYFKNVTEPNYHHLGTCAMLPRELGGVVDNDFKVYGTENVRVVDLGIIPEQIAGHSMAPLYGIAEWAVRKIRLDA